MRVHHFIVLIVMVACNTIAKAQGPAGYVDVPRDHRAYDSLNFMPHVGVIEGQPDGLFRGEEPLSRYEFVMALARLRKILDDALVIEKD